MRHISHLITLICLFTDGCLGFNMDTDVPTFKQGDDTSYFGFSVAQHIIENNPIILVGAPRDNNTVHGLVEPGAVYQCSLTANANDCDRILPDIMDRPREGEDSNRQWLGVSVSSQTIQGGNAAACGHRFRLVGQDYAWGEGLCVSMENDLRSIVDYRTPCEGKLRSKGHGEYGFCQAGTSLNVDVTGDMLVGTPGPYNWRGAITKSKVVFALEGYEWIWSPVEDLKSNSPPDAPEPTLGFYSYMGMSTHISENLWKNQKTFIGGAPRSNQAGEVLLYTYPSGSNMLALNRTLTGDQFASGFGYSVATLDIDANGQDDLVVGAPFYHGDGVGGAIYVYMNTNDQVLASDDDCVKIVSPKMSTAKCAELDCTNSRFGFSLASVGDLDQDGFEDVIVGAPYEGSGAIYVYRGSPSGLIAEPSQRITALEVSTPALMETFGYSLSGGVDMDANGYPDLIVGAYKSASVAVLRSRPVIRVQAQLISTPTSIDHSATRCQLDGSPNNCFLLKACFKFTAQPTNQFTGPLTLDYQIEAERFGGKSISRVFFKTGVTDQNQNHITTGTTRLYPQSNNQFKCESITAYIITGNKDFLNPLAFRLTYSLPEQTPPVITPQQPLPHLITYPVLDQQAAQVDLMVPFEKNCGDDDECQSDLDLDVRFLLDMDPETGIYLLKVGVTQQLQLNVQVQNRREDAHETTLTCVLPDNIDYINVDSVTPGSQYTCSSDNNIVVCQIGNPLLQHEIAQLKLRLNPLAVDASHQMLQFVLSTNTTSIDVDHTNNVQTVAVQVVLEADLLVRGDSYPREVYYGANVVGESAMTHEQEIGPNVIHTYEVKNLGDGRVSNSNLTIWWPYEAVSPYPQGKHLLYVMEPPQVDAPGVCTVNPDYINPLDLETDYDSSLEMFVKVGPVVAESASAVVKRSVDGIIQTRMPTPEYITEGGKTYTAVIMSCNPHDATAKCFKISCQLGEMWSKDSSVVRVRSRLWNSTFAEDYKNVDFVRVISYGEIYIDPALNVKQPNLRNDVHQIATKAIKDIKDKEGRGVPLWLIILAVIAGLILLVLIILLLWKCGFFKRRSATDEYRYSQQGKITKQKKTDQYNEDGY